MSQEAQKQRDLENKRSKTAALALALGVGLLLIGTIIIMRTLFAPKPQYNGNNSIDQLESDQEGEFYQNEQNSSQPDSAPTQDSSEE